MYTDLKHRIFKVHSARVWRTYFGGSEIEKWQGLDNPKDGEFPEEWVASVVVARNPGREHIEGEGLSKVSADGESVVLRDLISGDPEGFLGREHVQKYGTSMAFLTKIIDSLNRLTIQVHPDKTFAKNILHSDYGKTEAWYVLGGRKVNGEDPYVLLGFKQGITREKWKSLFEKQDIRGMLDSLHKVPVKAGDTFIIHGGVPHAIGSGCFLIEIQEPTDYTLRVERTTPEGKKMPDMLCHQGAGFDKMLDCFHYEGYTEEQMLKLWGVTPELIHRDENTDQFGLIGSKQTTLFGMNRLVIHKILNKTIDNPFSVDIVNSGKGTADYGQGSIRIKQGDFLFIPAGVGQVKLVNEGNTDLEVIECLPPV